MERLELKKNLYFVGIEDFEIKTFDCIMTTKYGSSFNSYLLVGSEKTALFETEKTKFFTEYKEEIEAITPIEKIDYIIMDHTEPDHADGIAELLKINPEITVVGTTVAVNNLKAIANRTDFKALIVRNMDTLSLGDVTLEFHVLPNLHWPDTMWTYAKELKALFPCDSFGTHYASEGILRSKVTDEEGYWDSVKYYFDCILGPFARPFMCNGLKCLDTLDVDLICTGHGPVLDSQIEPLVAKYKEWCAPVVREKKLVTMAYVSAYGYTAAIAEAIRKGIEDSGVEVHLYNLENAEEIAKAEAEVNTADGILLGSPTIVSEALPPVANLANHMFSLLVRSKPASAFGSYGWSGEAVPHLLEKLKQLRMNVQEGFKVQFKPSEEDLKNAEEYGRNFASLIK